MATTINDVVLIYFEDNPVAFARIEDINADHKEDWYHVTLLMLQLPLQVVTWILRDVYIDGETFTMGGKKMRLEKVVAPPATDEDEDNDEARIVQPSKLSNKRSDAKESKKQSETKKSNKKSGTKVVSLQDRMKR
jgi:hypothetical protein